MSEHFDYDYEDQKHIYDLVSKHDSNHYVNTIHSIQLLLSLAFIESNKLNSSENTLLIASVSDALEFTTELGKELKAQYVKEPDINKLKSQD